MNITTISKIPPLGIQPDMSSISDEMWNNYRGQRVLIADENGNEILTDPLLPSKEHVKDKGRKYLSQKVVPWLQDYKLTLSILHVLGVYSCDMNKSLYNVFNNQAKKT